MRRIVVTGSEMKSGRKGKSTGRNRRRRRGRGRGRSSGRGNDRGLNSREGSGLIGLIGGGRRRISRDCGIFRIRRVRRSRMTRTATVTVLSLRVKMNARRGRRRGRRRRGRRRNRGREAPLLYRSSKTEKIRMELIG